MDRQTDRHADRNTFHNNNYNLACIVPVYKTPEAHTWGKLNSMSLANYIWHRQNGYTYHNSGVKAVAVNGYETRWELLFEYNFPSCLSSHGTTLMQITATTSLTRVKRRSDVVQMLMVNLPSMHRPGPETHLPPWRHHLHHPLQRFQLSHTAAS